MRVIGVSGGETYRFSEWRLLAIAEAARLDVGLVETLIEHRCMPTNIYIP